MLNQKQNLCFIDVETTGVIFGHHELIEIGAIKTTHDGKILEKWEKKILPKFPERIEKEAQKINGFSIKKWNGAKIADKNLWNDFASFAEGCVPICHNPSFDRAFITISANEHGIFDLGLDYRWFGTESLALPFFVSGKFKSVSLRKICIALDIPPEDDVHRAINGADACRKVYFKLIKMLEEMLV